MTAASAVRTLATIQPGECLSIERVIFDSVRVRCMETDLREGTTTTCVAGTPDHLMLEAATGRLVIVERRWARFVEVDGTDDAGRELAICGN